ncbi:MAG: histidinol-phosphatase HisJ family protein [Acidaminococcaceae bacterium]|nr:histidinol-phosphatase HisJ family protein [Acidaminococcaceae bacterium]
MLFDTHMHADYSCDAVQTIVEAMEAAKMAGIGMILTEHWDRDYPTNPEEFQFNLQDYFAKNNKYRSETVLLGIEVGMQQHVALMDNQTIKAYPFDEVIASMHCMHGRDMYEPTSYEGLSKHEAVKKYLEDSVACLQLYKDFDTYGHIDYISRYMPYEDQNLHYSEHSQLWDQVFKLLINGDKAIEINTRRLDLDGAAENLIVLYKRFQELGGRYVTLGSDAHYSEHVGRRMQEALAIAQSCNLQPVYFKERKRMVIKEGE